MKTSTHYYGLSLSVLVLAAMSHVAYNLLKSYVVVTQNRTQDMSEIPYTMEVKSRDGPVCTAWHRSKNTYLI